MLVSLEIPNRDRAYEWVLQWMAAQQRSATSTSSSSLSPSSFLARLAPRSNLLSVETRVETHTNGSASVGFALVAGPGVHWLRYRGAWLQARRERDTKALNIASGIPWETVTLTTLARDRALLPKLLADARDAALREQEGRMVLYTAWGTEWRPFGKPRRKRPLSSVVLADGVKDRIVADVRAFLGRRKWYAERGMFFPLSHRCEIEVTKTNMATSRYSISERLPITRPTWFWQIVLHPGTRRRAQL